MSLVFFLRFLDFIGMFSVGTHALEGLVWKRELPQRRSSRKSSARDQSPTGPASTQQVAPPTSTSAAPKLPIMLQNSAKSSQRSGRRKSYGFTANHPRIRKGRRQNLGA